MGGCANVYECLSVCLYMRVNVGAFNGAPLCEFEVEIVFSVSGKCIMGR